MNVAVSNTGPVCHRSILRNIQTAGDRRDRFRNKYTEHNGNLCYYLCSGNTSAQSYTTHFLSVSGSGSVNTPLASQPLCVRQSHSSVFALLCTLYCSFIGCSQASQGVLRLVVLSLLKVYHVSSTPSDWLFCSITRFNMYRAHPVIDCSVLWCFEHTLWLVVLFYHKFYHVSSTPSDWLFCSITSFIMYRAHPLIGCSVLSQGLPCIEHTHWLVILCFGRV